MVSARHRIVKGVVFAIMLGFIFSAALLSAEIVSYPPSSKIIVNQDQPFTISVEFKNTGNSGAYFWGGTTIWDANGNRVFDEKV